MKEIKMIEVCPYCGSQNFEFMGDEYAPQEYHCHECDMWWREDYVPKDRNGEVIRKGDKVIWYDPQTEYRDTNRVWQIDEIREDMVLISDDAGECECLHSEIAKVKPHYSKAAKLAVANQLQNMMYNDITCENGCESFECWCANGEIFENEGMDAESVRECMQLVREIAPKVDDIILNYLNTDMD